MTRKKGSCGLAWAALAALSLVHGCGGGGGVAPPPPPPPSESIQVTAGTTSVSMGTPGWQLAAFLVRANGTQLNIINEATWTSSNPSVLTVVAGAVTPMTPGQATVTVAYQGKTGSIQLTVSPDVTALSIGGTVAMSYLAGTTIAQTTPLSGIASLVASRRCTTAGVVYASGVFTDATCDVTTLATWNSSNPSVVSVTNGLLTAVGAGQATVSATYHTVTGNLQVVVSGTALNLTGNWSGQQDGSQSPFPMTLNLTQTGNNLSATATVQYPFISGWGSVTTNITGTVSGATVAFDPKNNLGGCFNMTIRLTVTSATNSRIAGTWAKTGNCDVTSAGGTFVITK